MYIADIIDAIDHIQSYCKDISEEMFSQNILLQDAVIRRVQIIGEAAAKIPDIVRKQYPKVAWKQIVAQRNLIIHDYATVRPHEVWMVIKKDLPVLKSQLMVVKDHLQK